MTFFTDLSKQADGEISGDCQPAKLLLSGGACPAGGTFTSAPYMTPEVVDDLSGGATVVNLPSLTNTIPDYTASVPAGTR